MTNMTTAFNQCAARNHAGCVGNLGWMSKGLAVVAMARGSA